MDIIFSDKKLRKIVNDHSQLVKKYGVNCAKLIARRLNEIHASPNLQSLRDLYPRSRCHPLSGDRCGQFAVDVEHPKRLILKPCEQPPPTKEDGGIDLVAIVCVDIIELGDYHG